MPFNGSGEFLLTYSWVTEQASSPIEISKLDTQEQDIADGLSNCILRDGTGKPTADIDWNNQDLQNLAGVTFTAGSTATTSLLRPVADATLYSLLGAPKAGPGILGKWSSATTDRYLAAGFYDNVGAFTESFRIKDGALFEIASSASGTSSGAQIKGTVPALLFNETDASSNEKLWDIVAVAGTLQLRAMSDDSLTGIAALTVARSGIAPTRVTVGAPLKMHTASSDPSGTNGDVYYNTTTHKFRGYANGSWVDLH